MPKSSWILPEGVTLEMLDEYARKKENERRRADYARHPERAERNRMSSYTNFLNRHEKLVFPMPPAPPWDDMQKQCILRAVEIALSEQRRGADR